MKKMNQRAGLSPEDFILTVMQAIACLVTYRILIHGLFRYVDHAHDLLGGLWGVLATVFVFRETRSASREAGISLLIATSVSFVLCMAYLWTLPFNAVGMVVLLAIGTLVMTLLGRRDSVAATSVTTAVVLIVAALDPLHAVEQPWLRVVDTAVGVVSGICWRFAGSLLISRLGWGEP
jgi:uncharacterized membrane protein YccC